MKKKYLAIFLVMILIVALSITALASSGVSGRQILSWLDNPWESFSTVLSEAEKQDAVMQTTDLNIPIYLEDDLLFKTDGLFYLNRDACFYEGLNSMPNDSSAIMAAYPTSAIRKRGDNSVYTMYDTETGYRLYLLFDGDNNYLTTMGFPVVIKEMLWYDDFSGLEVGDSIGKVESIDPVATLHKKTIIDVWDLDPKGAEFHAKNGYPCTSVHYLKDGILKIEYKMLNDQSLVISDMVFSDDYTLENAKGKVINYRINDNDLPS